MLLIASLLALAAQGKASSDDLIARLADDAPDVRVEATEALYRKGEAVEPLLRRRLNRSGNPEVRARLQEVVDRLARDRARRTFKGGPEVAGLSARLSAKPAKHGGFSMTLEIMNVGPVPASLVPPRVWDLSKPGMNSRSSSSHGRIILKGRTPRRSNRMWMSIGCGGSPSRKVTITLAPGECHRATFEVGNSTGMGGVLLPDEYEVQVVYFAKGKTLVPGAKADLDSTSATIRIE